MTSQDDCVPSTVLCVDTQSSVQRGMEIPVDQFSLGAAVCVARGALAGLKGTIVRRTDDELDCFLKIEGWPLGAYLVLNSRRLLPSNTPGDPTANSVSESMTPAEAKSEGPTPLARAM